MLSLARQRGYVYFLSAKGFGEHNNAVIFLKELDEDIQALIDSGYREYEFPERADAEEAAFVEQMCAAAANM